MTPKPKSTREHPEPDSCHRLSCKPLVLPSDVVPSCSGLEVIGVLNPTFVRLHDTRSLIVRVDERPCQSNGAHRLRTGVRRFTAARVTPGATEVFEPIDVDVPSDFDANVEPFLREHTRNALDCQILLSFVSHLRLARFGPHGIVVDPSPLVFPDHPLCSFGCEDPRATSLDGHAIITYSGLSQYGSTGWMAQLAAPTTVKHRQIILGPDHKHLALFPQRIDGFYCMLIRPLTRLYVRANGIWLVRSPDLVHWGAPEPVLFPRPASWDSDRVGPAAGPIWTAAGWLFLYYGVDRDSTYHAGAALLHHTRPSTVVGRSSAPLLSPVLDWERQGRRADTVFPCGMELLDDVDMLRVYYGAADTCIGAAEIRLSNVIGAMCPP